jgi:uncharacterized repeat protein (TIGR01451 family)
VVDKTEKAMAGDQLTVSYYVKNIGTAGAGASDTSMYVNGVLHDVDDPLPAFGVPPLGVGASFKGMFAPVTCQQGTTLNIKVCADEYLVVVESDETNNCNDSSYTCPAPVDLPDLKLEKTVKKQLIPGGDPTKGCRYTVEWNVTNIGGVAAGGSTVALVIDGVLEDTEACLGLNPGISANGDFGGWYNCKCGETNTVEVYADYGGGVTESDETNNYVTNDVKCQFGAIEVNKTVHDPADDKVEEIDAEHGDVVKFNCTVHNTGCCCALTGITVKDVLSDSLKYINATPVPDRVDVTGGVTILEWYVAGPLEPCSWLNYTINATVIGSGVDTNTQSVIAMDCTGGIVTDSDTATVNVGTRAGIHVTKTNVTGYNFTLVVTNNGSSCDLTDVHVWDTMTNLTYVQMVQGDTPVPIIITGNVTTLHWAIPSLATGASETFIVNTTKIAAGLAAYNNTLSAYGLAACTNANVNSNVDTWSQP